MTHILKAGQVEASEAVQLNARQWPAAGEAEPGQGYDSAEYENDADILDMGQLAPEVDAAQREADALLAQAEAEARELLEQARSEAAALLGQAQARIRAEQDDARRELAAERDQLEREVQGRLEAHYRERYAAALTALEQAGADFAQRRDEYLSLIEQPAFELILKLAETLIRSEFKAEPACMLRLIADSFLLLKPQEVAHVAVHPQAFERLLADELFVSVLSERGIQPQRIELELDETLGPAQFTLRVNGVSLSYDLEANLAEMVQQLRERAASME